jgi:DNA-binding LytR/AlgR family response regulator
MERLHVAVCDDDASAIGIIASSLKDVFSQHGMDASVSLFNSALDLRKSMESRRYDLLLLDIDMPGLDGITFAHELRDAGSQIDIMYISNREDLVFDSLRVSPEGFIRKSRFLQDMSGVVGDYLNARRRRHEVSSIVLQRQGLVRPVRAEAIVYVEGRRKEQVLHLAENNELLSMRSTMHALEEELEPAGFIRIHQGYLVNYRFVRLIEDGKVLLITGEELPISRRKTTEVRTAYLELVQRGDQLVY